MTLHRTSFVAEGRLALKNRMISRGKNPVTVNRTLVTVKSKPVHLAGTRVKKNMVGRKVKENLIETLMI
jgi:hypothetical protein